MSEKEFEFISTTSAWHEACQHLGSQDCIAVDVEANAPK